MQLEIPSVILSVMWLSDYEQRVAANLVCPLPPPNRGGDGGGGGAVPLRLGMASLIDIRPSASHLPLWLSVSRSGRITEKTLYPMLPGYLVKRSTG